MAARRPAFASAAVVTGSEFEATKYLTLDAEC